MLMIVPTKRFPHRPTGYLYRQIAKGIKYPSWVEKDIGKDIGRCTTGYDERVQMDKFYMQKCTIWMDLVILLKTPFAVIKGHGAV
jgi:lipopolysaccharide/colanic/teichoic acid biosynthesis glycosyltransferase